MKTNSQANQVPVAVKEIVENPDGHFLYLYGEPDGRENSILLAAVEEINAAGRGPALFISFPLLRNWLKQANDESFPYQMDYKFHIQLAIKTRVLAIGDFDKASVASCHQEALLELLGTRRQQAMAGKTATLFASQTAPDDWPEPIRDLIKDGQGVKLTLEPAPQSGA